LVLPARAASMRLLCHDERLADAFALHGLSAYRQTPKAQRLNETLDQIWPGVQRRSSSLPTQFLCGPEDSSTKHADLHPCARGGSSFTDKEGPDASEDTGGAAKGSQALPKEEVSEVNPQCTQARKVDRPRCCLCMNGEAIWSQDGSCKHCKDNGGIKDCSEVDENCQPGSVSWPLKYKEPGEGRGHVAEGEKGEGDKAEGSKPKDWNEEDDNRGEICAETCAERWMSKIAGEMNIPRARPPQKASPLTKAAEEQAANQAKAAKEQEELEAEIHKHGDEIGAVETPEQRI